MDFPYARTLASYGPYLIAGAGAGYVYVSTDRGSHWTSGGSGLPDMEVNAVHVMGNDLYVGMSYAGVWRRPLSGLLVSATEERTPVPGNSLAAYPNPFNGISEIGFQIADWAEVDLRVFDLLGREVAVLLNERRAPGKHAVRFDAGALASGVYVCRMTAGSFSSARAMLLLR
jgi:hypothetical protein